MLYVGTGALILLSEYGTYVSLIKKRNKTQDKNTLFKRILKYGVLGEIISPKDEREMFIQSVNKMIENFEKINC